jgi:hypothetical protein
VIELILLYCNNIYTNYIYEIIIWIHLNILDHALLMRVSSIYIVLCSFFFLKQYWFIVKYYPFNYNRETFIYLIVIIVFLLLMVSNIEVISADAQNETVETFDPAPEKTGKVNLATKKSDLFIIVHPDCTSKRCVNFPIPLSFIFFIDKNGVYKNILELENIFFEKNTIIKLDSTSVRCFYYNKDSVLVEGSISLKHLWFWALWFKRYFHLLDILGDMKSYFAFLDEDFKNGGSGLNSEDNFKRWLHSISFS